MTSAGELRERVAWEQVAVSDSSYGTIAGDWTERFQTRARIRPLVGQEPVLAQRLQGIQPFVITVRSSSDTRDITNTWRARNARTGMIYSIRAVTPDETNEWIDILAEHLPEAPV